MENFFYESCKIDKGEIEEMLLRRYHNINYIMNMPADDFFSFYKLAKEKEREERIFAQWVVQLPNMTKDTFTSFEDYRDKVTGKNIDTRSTQELLDDLNEVEKRLERG